MTPMSETQPTPGQDGWTAWFGGENPAPGQMVFYKMRGHRDEGEYGPDLSDECTWRWTEDDHDIIAFRLSPPAGSPPSSKTEHVAGDAVSPWLMQDLMAAEKNGVGGIMMPCATFRSLLAEIADLKARNKALEEGLRKARDLDTQVHHDGYDDRGNYTYRDVVFADELFPIIARTLTEADHGR